MGMSRPNPASRSRYSLYPSSTPLLPSSTFTFLASLRGQLLICTVVLVLGAIYLVVREPISTFRRHRREALSRIREEELMSMEFEEKDDGKVLKEREKDKERGREKRKDGKRRKGSLLRIAGGSEESSAAGPSSIESSPASLRAVPTIFQSSPIANDATPPTPRSPSPTPANPQPSPLVERQINANRLLPPLPIIISQQASPRPWEIPLPDSPAAGPSRLSSAEAEDVSVNGDDASDSALSNEPDSKQIGRSNGFSIIPEEGYLPVVPVTTSTKKKRRKAKAVSPFLARSLSAGPTDTSHTEFSSRHASPAGRSPLEPSSRHARKASLSRPPNADLEDLLDERDRLIDSLRAEIGRAKAEEGKARESVRIAQANEERTSRDVDQMRRTSHKTESESRRRHRELQGRMNQMNQVHDAALYRLDTLERLIRESGSPVPPPSPLPMLHLQSSTSPIPPPSPFGMQTAPSLGLAYIPYPSPGMYPSPILHPYHYAQPSNSRKLMRRSSNGELNGNDSVGALSSGQLMPSRQPSGAYPSIGSGTMPLGSPAIRVPSPSSLREGQSSAADLRRLSIESSVLKKKIKPKSGSESGESSSNRAGSEPLIEANESLEGLGFVVEGADGNRLATISVPNVSSQGNSNSGEGSTSSSSHPASPSPQPRSHILVTPATADPFHRNGTHTFDSPALAPHLNGIKVVIDNEQGNLYFRDDQSPSREPSPLSEGEKIGEEKREYSEPVFASLAHTPEQLREIARMREDAVRAQRGRKRLSEVTGVGVVVAPLTPSLGQSPMPLNRE